MRHVCMYAHMCVPSRSARNFENYRVFSHVKRNTQLLFHTGAKKDSPSRKHTHTHRDFSTPDHPTTRATYRLSRYRRKVCTLTTIYIYNSAGCFIGLGIARRTKSRRNGLGACFMAKCAHYAHTCYASLRPVWCAMHHVLPREREAVVFETVN